MNGGKDKNSDDVDFCQLLSVKAKVRKENTGLELFFHNSICDNVERVVGSEL